MLLTRPPLKSEEASFFIIPLDLHVLGTPPAFVLSQDQTLHNTISPIHGAFLRQLRSFTSSRTLSTLRCSLACFLELLVSRKNRENMIAHTLLLASKN